MANYFPAMNAILISNSKIFCILLNMCSCTCANIWISHVEVNISYVRALMPLALLNHLIPFLPTLVFFFFNSGLFITLLH